MNKFILIALFATALFAEETAIKGEVIDLSCYMDHGAKGEKHLKCASSCLEKGLPMGILAENGNIYVLIENHSKADAYAAAKKMAAQQVEVKGTVFEKGGVRSITVEAIEAAH